MLGLVTRAEKKASNNKNKNDDGVDNGNNNNRNNNNNNIHYRPWCSNIHVCFEHLMNRNFLACAWNNVWLHLSI